MGWWVQAKVENVTVGPAITRYELKPAEGVRVSKIANLADDIALNLAAETIRIEAPIPGKQAVGIEVPNQEKEMVHLRDVLESDEFAEIFTLVCAIGSPPLYCVMCSRSPFQVQISDISAVQ